MGDSDSNDEILVSQEGSDDTDTGAITDDDVDMAMRDSKEDVPSSSGPSASDKDYQVLLFSIII
jgi:hypothetical protein